MKEVKQDLDLDSPFTAKKPSPRKKSRLSKKRISGIDDPEDGHYKTNSPNPSSPSRKQKQIIIEPKVESVETSSNASESSDDIESKDADDKVENKKPELPTGSGRRRLK